MDRAFPFHIWDWYGEVSFAADGQQPKKENPGPSESFDMILKMPMMILNSKAEHSDQHMH
jgi:hypothetical protein